MRTTSLALALVLLGASPVALIAQGAKPAAPAITTMSSLKPLYDMVKGYVIKSAEQMPEANFAFKPTPEVRSFGGIIGHLANENYDFCANASGRKNPNATDFEKVSGKADLVAGIKGAFAFCDAVYEMKDAAFMVPTEIFGMKMTRMTVAIMTVTHSFEHYGNLITYFRLKGMVPPSSQAGM